MKIYTHENTGDLPGDVVVRLEVPSTNLTAALRALASEMDHREDTAWNCVDTRNSTYNPPHNKRIKSKLYIAVTGVRKPTPDELAACEKEDVERQGRWLQMEVDKSMKILKKLGYTVTKKVDKKNKSK